MAWFYASGVVFAVLGGADHRCYDFWKLLSRPACARTELIGIVESEDDRRTPAEAAALASKAGRA